MMNRMIFILLMIGYAFSIYSPLIKTNENQIKSWLPTLEYAADSVIQSLESSHPISLHRIHSDHVQVARADLYTIKSEIVLPPKDLESYRSYKDIQISFFSPHNNPQFLWSITTPPSTLLIGPSIEQDKTTSRSSSHENRLTTFDQSFPDSPYVNPILRPIEIEGPVELFFDERDHSNLVEFYLPNRLEIYGRSGAGRNVFVEAGTKVTIHGIYQMDLLESLPLKIEQEIINNRRSDKIGLQTRRVPKIGLKGPSVMKVVSDDRNVKAKMMNRNNGLSIHIVNKTIVDSNKHQINSDQICRWEVDRRQGLGGMLSQTLTKIEMNGGKVHGLLKGTRLQSGHMIMLPMELEEETEGGHKEISLWQAVLMRLWGEGSGKEEWKVLSASKLKREERQVTSISDSLMTNGTWTSVVEGLRQQGLM